MIISESFAQEVSSVAADQSSILPNILPIVIVFAIFYFIIIRPQRRRMHEHNTMLDNLSIGDKVIVANGIVGRVAKLNNENIWLEISDGVVIEAVKSGVTDLVLSKAEKTSHKKNEKSQNDKNTNRKKNK